MKVIWINDEATYTGGAETYIYQSAQELAKRYNVENILLYSAESRIDHEYSKVFSFTTVVADLKQQLKLLEPDVIYVHQVDNTEIIKELSEIKIPVVGFVHDHKHFCLREHKYTAIGNETCTKAVQPYSTAISAKRHVPSTLVFTPSAGFASTKGTCL